VKLSPVRIAIVAALVIVAIVVCVLRPASLTVQHTQPAIVRTADPTAQPVPLRMRARPLVYVAGAVVHPGVYDVPDDARARDAIAKAGGAAHDADLVAVNLAAHIADGDEIAVPRIGDAHPPARAAHPRTAHSGGHRRRRSPRNDSARTEPPAARDAPKLDLNSATEDALAELPGIGPVLAERIVEFRALNGPFPSVDSLADVAGITPLHLDEIEPLVTVGR
jgi:competence protein ComEA